MKKLRKIKDNSRDKVYKELLKNEDYNTYFTRRNDLQIIFISQNEDLVIYEDLNTEEIVIYFEKENRKSLARYTLMYFNEETSIFDLLLDFLTTYKLNLSYLKDLLNTDLKEYEKYKY